MAPSGGRSLVSAPHTGTCARCTWQARKHFDKKLHMEMPKLRRLTCAQRQCSQHEAPRQEAPGKHSTHSKREAPRQKAPAS